MATLYPFFANLTAMAFPIPLEAPVMSTVFLDIENPPFLTVVVILFYQIQKENAIKANKI